MPAYKIPIDEARLDACCEAYFKWKDLNVSIKNIHTRGINMPDVISEPIVCYVMGYLWNRGKQVGDATRQTDDAKIEIKATSRWAGDLSSFGPTAQFDDLVFARFNLDNNMLFIYDLDINSTDFSNYPANSRQTIREQQEQTRRPHVSLQTIFVDANNLLPNVIFDLRLKRIYRPNSQKYNELIHSLL